MDKKEKILDIMSTKTSGSREHQKLVDRLVKQMTKEHRARLTRSRPYSVSLSKVFGDKLLRFL